MSCPLDAQMHERYDEHTITRTLTDLFIYLLYMHSSNKMSLKPKRVNFDETWQDLRQTVKEVITLGNVKRNIWSDRFR